MSGIRKVDGLKDLEIYKRTYIFSGKIGIQFTYVNSHKFIENLVEFPAVALHCYVNAI